MFDLFASITLLIVLLPVMLLISILIWLYDGSPLFFKQLRPGLHGRPFMLVKFRTMLNQNDKSGDLLNDDERLTGLGKILRKTSLDELPELVNVITGQMSLVGPRPLLMEYLELYSEEQMRRHTIKPGITGWAQVNGRNAISWEEKFRLDCWYVDNQSLLLDIKILLLTVVKVFQGEGIGQKGMETTKKFTGSE